MSTELQTLRGRVFFWIGLAVFPMFWVWWMSLRYFSPRQIRIARWWATLYVILLIAAWFVFPVLRTRVSDLQWTYSHIAFQVGLVLWIWLLFRITSIGQILMGLIVAMDAIAILSSLVIPIYQKMLPHPGCLIYVIVPAVAHLLIEPIRRLRERWTGRDTEGADQLP